MLELVTAFLAAVAVSLTAATAPAMAAEACAGTDRAMVSTDS